MPQETMPSKWTRIVDVGTEFGVRVDALGKTDTQVLEGKVRVYLISERKSRGIELVAGEAVAVGADGRSIRKVAPFKQLLATDFELHPEVDSTRGLIAHFEFEDGPGSSTAVDSSGNGHTGTLLGGASIINDVDRGLVYSGDGDGSHLEFDSTVAVPNLAANGGVTLAAWVKVTNLAGSDNTAAALTLGTTGNNPLVIMSVTSGGLGGYIDSTGGSAQTSFPGAGTDGLVAQDIWTHIAITFDRFNHEAKLYVNGSLDWTVSIGSDTGELDWQGRADVGGYSKYSAKQTFQGLIDDARYYDVVLTSPEIRSLFNDRSFKTRPHRFN